MPTDDSLTSPSPLWLNIGCGTHRAPDPWVNVDVVDNDEVHPDVLRDPDGPLPFDDGTAERVFAGHVFEHMAWPVVPEFLADIRRVLAPGGELLIVGPDVIRAIRRWRDGDEPWEIVLTVLEHVHNYGFETFEQWPNARHWWNCHEERMFRVVEQSGMFGTVERLSPPTEVVWDGWLPPWPVVGIAPWQFAVRAVV